MKLPGIKEFLSQYDSLETRRAYKRDIFTFFMTTKKTPVGITRIEALAYLNKLKEHDFSSSSINRMVSSVRSYMKFLVFMDVIPKNPLEGMKLPRVRHAEEDGMTDGEVEKIFAKLSKKDERTRRDEVIISLMLYNGLRRSEVCGLNMGDIKKNGDNRLIEVRGKGDKVRIIPLHPECWQAIIEYLKCCDRLKGKPSEPVLCRKDGKRIDTQVVYNTVKRLQKAANIKRSLHPHMFRAKFASMALESGQPITSVQADMGHSSIETTAIYDHAKRRLERSAILGIPPVKRKKK